MDPVVFMLGGSGVAPCRWRWGLGLARPIWSPRGYGCHEWRWPRSERALPPRRWGWRRWSYGVPYLAAFGGEVVAGMDLDLKMVDSPVPCPPCSEGMWAIFGCHVLLVSGALGASSRSGETLDPMSIMMLVTLVAPLPPWWVTSILTPFPPPLGPERNPRISGFGSGNALTLFTS